jgi:DNA repair protein RadC
MRLCDWPVGERPRERLLARGPAALSDAELLAVIVGGAAAGQGGAVAACRRMLRDLGGLRELARWDASQLLSLPGIGQARACALSAAVEVGRRVACAPPRPERPMTRSEAAYALLGGRLGTLRQEVFHVLSLDARNRVLNEARVAQGSATAVEVHPREVFLPAVRAGAVSIIAAHNHPSGDPEPSADDLELTTELRRAGEILGIPLLDHLIIGCGGYVSLADRGLL